MQLPPNPQCGNSRSKMIRTEEPSKGQSWLKHLRISHRHQIKIRLHHQVCRKISTHFKRKLKGLLSSLIIQKKKKDSTHTSRIGFQSRIDELMKTIPFLETVAGEALSMLWGSKTILQFGAMGIRSPLARVRVLLSSKTEFRFSIQMASTGPSRTIQMCSPKKSHQRQAEKHTHIDI